MLDREGKFLDVKEVLLPQQTIDVDTQSMSSQLGVQTGTQPPEGVSMVGLQLELLDQLAVDRLDDLPHAVEALRHRLGQLLLLVGTGHGHQADAVALKKGIGHTLADVPLVCHSIQVGVFLQQFISALQVSNVGWYKFEVKNYPSQRNEELHLVPEDHLLLGRNSAKGGSIGSPLSRSVGHQVELHHRHRQTVYATLPILGHVQRPQHHLAHQIESVHQLPSASVEAALRWDVREQVTVATPLRKEAQLRIPPFALSDQRHRHQLTVRAARSRTWAREEVAHLSVGVFHDAVHPQAKVVKVGYH